MRRGAQSNHGSPLRMRPRTALAVFIVLGIIHLWPLSIAPWRLSMNYHADADYNAWAIAWINRTLPTDPASLFDANIFAPEDDTLAYSHPVVAPALFVAPLSWVGASPVLLFNVSMFGGLVLTAWATWWLVRQWTASDIAGLVSGALAAYNVHLLTRLAHVSAAHAWGLPLSLYLSDRLVRQPSRRHTILLALVVAGTAGSSLYWLAIVMMIIAGRVLVSRRGVLATVAAATGGLALVSPLLLPYVRLAQDGFRRPLSMVADFSAELTGYLSSTSVLHAGWSAGFYRDDVNALFAGVLALALAALGAAVSIRNRATRRGALLLVSLAASGIVLSLGPVTALYRWFYEWFLPLQGLRAVARFGFLYLFAIAVMAGFGVAWLETRSRLTAHGMVAAGLLLIAGVTAEAWQGPVRVDPFTGVPPIYSVVAGADEPVLLVEVPFYPPDAVHFNGPYVLNSTAHWQPLMNGTSGATPQSYRDRAETFWYFPGDRAIQAIRESGATLLMVHAERFEPHERPALREALLEPRGLRLLAADPLGHSLYKVEPPEVDIVAEHGR